MSCPFVEGKKIDKIIENKAYDCNFSNDRYLLFIVGEFFVCLLYFFFNCIVCSLKTLPTGIVLTLRIVV